MRPIDAEMLKEKLSEAIKDAPLYIQVTVDQYIDEVPTLTPPNEPLTQDDVNEMHFDRVWIDYGTDEHGKRDGEEGIVLYGKLYSIDTLDGAGLEDMILDATGHGGDTLDNPSGNYTVYRRPPEGEEDSNV